MIYPLNDGCVTCYTCLWMVKPHRCSSQGLKILYFILWFHSGNTFLEAVITYKTNQRRREGDARRSRSDKLSKKAVQIKNNTCYWLHMSYKDLMCLRNERIMKKGKPWWMEIWQVFINTERNCCRFAIYGCNIKSEQVNRVGSLIPAEWLKVYVLYFWSSLT